MGGGGTTSTSSTVKPPKAVSDTQNLLLGGLRDTYKEGIKPFDQSLYAGVGNTTKDSWAQTLGAAGNQDFASGMSGSISELSDIAAGNRYGMNDPGYATLRSNIASDVMRETNAAFDGSGMFGSDSNREAAGEGLGNALAGLDYANHQQDRAFQQQAMQMLPGAYQASLMPGATMGAVGAAQDAHSQAELQGENDLFRRLNDVNWDRDARASSILAGTAQGAGSTTTNTQPSTPWWQTAASLGLGAAGLFL